MKCTAAIFCLLLLACASVAAAPQLDWGREIEPAQRALSAGDQASAYRQFKRFAPHNPLAQFSLGLFEQNGWGREANPVAACAWFEQAATKHIPAAEHLWGNCLAQGIGRKTDIPAAVNWYEKAAEHGHLISWCTAADYYLAGKGIPQNTEKGLALCLQAAQRNSPPAMIWLAEHFRDGTKVQQDLVAARYWYQQGAERNSAQAQYQFGLMLKDGAGGSQDRDAALFWLESAAANGCADAYLPTATLYAEAPVEASTGALPSEHLAKAYLWLAAAKATAADPGQQIAIDQLLRRILTVMPTSWRASLDGQVAAHLAQFQTLKP